MSMPPVSSEQLLGALLNAQLQQNEMLGRLLTQLSQESQARQLQANSLAAWKMKYPEMVDQCKEVYPKLDETFTFFMGGLLDAIHDMDNEPNEFAVREFVDKYGQILSQFSVILHMLGNLAQLH